MSQFEPNVEETELINFVNDSLGISNATVAKLIPKGRSIESLEFVCFKVGVDFDLKAKALSKESWPHDVFIRSFDNSNFRPRQLHRLLQPNTLNVPRHPQSQIDISTSLLQDLGEESSM